MNQEKVGNLIKKIRKDEALTQEKFASKYGVTFQAVSKWENGKSLPDISILKKICDDYNYDLNEFLSGEEIDKKKKKKIVFLILGVIFIIMLILLIVFTINHLNDNEDFNFKTLTTTCENFKLYGSMAYNDNKTSIYISNLTYCGEEKNKEYKKLECSLYEKDDTIKVKISNYTYDEIKSITLDEFLKDVNFNIDNYSKTCKTYRDNGLVLEITATKDKDNVDFFEIPLRLEDNCS